MTVTSWAGAVRTTKKSQVFAGAALCAALCTSVPSAHADDARDHAWEWGDDRSEFAEKGKIAVSSDAAFSVQQRVQSDGEGRAISVVLAPAADYFVVKNWSVGALVGYTFSKSGDDRSSRTIVGPRVGYNVELTGLFSLWPRIGVSYANSRAVEDDVKLARHSLALNVSLPLMIHHVTNFFIGFGPYVDTDLTGTPRATQFGGKLTMGGSPFDGSDD